MKRIFDNSNGNKDKEQDSDKKAGHKPAKAAASHKSAAKAKVEKKAKVDSHAKPSRAHEPRRLRKPTRRPHQRQKQKSLLQHRDAKSRAFH